jgi:hypothetical protein
MVNIKDIKDKIQEEVTTLACNRFNVNEDEVNISFSSAGELKVTISPKDFIDSINCEVMVEINLSFGESDTKV